MQQIETDSLPVISQEWGQENQDEKTYYINPFPRRCKKWVKYQTELFKKHNPINACDIEGKTTPYNSRIYFNQENLTGYGGIPFLISFIEKMGIEDGLEDVFDHAGYIYSTTDLLLSAITEITVGVDRIYHLNAIRNDTGLTKSLSLNQLPEETNIRRQLTKSSSKEVERMRAVLS